MGKLVLYTAIFGGKDSYQEPPEGDYDIVLFTDRPPEKTKKAKVVCVSGDGSPRRQARFYKVNSQILFPDYEYTVWIDGLIGIRKIDIRDFVEKWLSKADLVAHRHVCRNCIYAEAEECIRLKLDDPTVIRKQMSRYQTEGYPAGAGLAETGTLFRRNTPEVARFNETWKNEIQNGSVRDQLSFNYAIWKTGVRFSYIPKSQIRHGSGPGFYIRGHLY